MNVSTRRAKVSHAFVQLRLKQQKVRCFWCGLTLQEAFHVDHVIPVAKGGDHLNENSVLTHESCNISKRDKLPWEYVSTTQWLEAEKALNVMTSGKFAEYLRVWQMKPEGVKTGVAQSYAKEKPRKGRRELTGEDVRALQKLVVAIKDVRLDPLVCFTAKCLRAFATNEPKALLEYCHTHNHSVTWSTLREHLMRLGKEHPVTVGSALYAEPLMNLHIAHAFPYLQPLWEETRAESTSST